MTRARLKKRPRACLCHRREKAKWNAPGDLINGTLNVWQRYNANDSTTYTNPDELYVADRFRSNGTGTVKPNARGYGADITGTVTMQYWMEKSDFALLPDPVVVYYSVGGEMQSTSTAKTSVPTDSDGKRLRIQPGDYQSNAGLGEPVSGQAGAALRGRIGFYASGMPQYTGSKTEIRFCFPDMA